MFAMQFLRAFNPMLEQVRNRKRRSIFLKKMMLLKKLGLRWKYAKKAAPKRSFMELQAMRKAQQEGTCSEQFPSRKQLVPLEELRDLALADNVYFTKYYKPRVFSLSEAIEMHREMMQPTIYNNPEAELHLRLDINMDLEKEGKFVEPSSKIVAIPHPFATDVKRTICLFSKSEDVQMQATEAGATMTGGKPLIKKLLRTEVRADFTFFIAHIDIIADIGPLRGLLKNKFPTVKSGTVGTNVVAMVNHFRNGLELEIERDVKNPSWGVVKIIIGNLTMPVAEIAANLQAVCQTVCALRPMVAKLGPTVHRAVLMCPPSDEYFHLPFEEFCPKFPEAELAKARVLAEQAAQAAINEAAKAAEAHLRRGRKEKVPVDPSAPHWTQWKYDGLVDNFDPHSMR